LFQDKESWDMKNNAEKIEAAAKKKEEGNAWFKMGKYVKASKRYEKVNKHFWSKSNRLKYVTISSW
jgi:FK506-binding protein 4/5